jgi:hypothetical protein
MIHLEEVSVTDSVNLRRLKGLENALELAKQVLAKVDAEFAEEEKNLAQRKAIARATALEEAELALVEEIKADIEAEREYLLRLALAHYAETDRKTMPLPDGTVTISTRRTPKVIAEKDWDSTALLDYATAKLLDVQALVNAGKLGSLALDPKAITQEIVTEVRVLAKHELLTFFYRETTSPKISHKK